MANRVLNIGGNLSARLASVLTLVQGVLTVQLHGAQNRVVTEAALPAGAVSSSPGSSPYSTASKPLGAATEAAQQNFAPRCSAEISAQLSQQQVQVRGVIAVATRPARRENAGSAVEQYPRQAGIVSNSDQPWLPRQQHAPSAGVLQRRSRRSQGTSGAFTGGVNHLGVNVQAVNASAQNFAQFVELALIVACQNNLCVCRGSPCRRN